MLWLFRHSPTYAIFGKQNQETEIVTFFKNMPNFSLLE
jgi:hypothetical protein